MARGKRGGFMDRLLMGKEKSEGFARASLPSNRWELFWDIFKGKFFKLLFLNILVLVFFLPLILLIVYRIGLLSTYGTVYPFAQSFGVGYLAPVSLVGYAENITFSVNTYALLLLPVVSIIASIGIAGGAYVMRNIVWTEGVFMANDFWKGIKQNFRQLAIVSILYSVAFYVLVLFISFSNQAIVAGSTVWLFTTLKILAIVLLVFTSIVALHMITMCVTYDLPLRHLIKNGLVMTIGMFFSNAIILALALIPYFLLLFGGIVLTIGIIILLGLGVTYPLLVWTIYCQWIYDGYINDKVKGAKKNRGIYEKVKKDSSTLEKYKNQREILNIHTFLTSMPIKPITDDELKLEELPQSFRREDIIKLNESRQKLIDDSDKYVSQHISDDKYVQASVNIETEQTEAQKRIEKARKELAKRKKHK